MAIGKGAAKQLRSKRQTAKGTLAVAGTGGQVVRREVSTFELSKETYTTESEQTSRRQVMSARHGPRLVNGAVRGILSPGTYADWFSSLLYRDFTAVAAITGMSITIAGTGPTWTITRAAGDWLAGGAKIGRVIRLTAGAFAAGNLNKNALIIGATALVLTVRALNRLPFVAEGPIASATASFPGGVTWVPESGHTDIYYTIEEWFSDIPRSERTLDVKFHAATLRLPGSGNAGVDWTATGLDQTKDTTVYFAAPAVETTTDAVVAASGALLVGGVQQAIVTDMSITLDNRGSPADPVVGTDIRPDIFTDKLFGSGSLTAYFDGGTLSDNFIDEVTTSVVSALTAGNANNADFIIISMHDVKLNSASPDDVATGLKRTYNFSAQFNKLGGAALATNATTIEMQDSAVIPV